MINIRTGFGFDVHQLAEGYDFWLGGIKLDHHKGSVGHSDADVLIHAVCDALLGACNLRDIGFHFPDTDPKYKGVDSKLLLKEVAVLIRKKGYEIGNIDSTIALQSPKVKDYLPQMQQVMAHVMDVEADQVAIKATTTEKLGFEGREEGVSAYASVLVYKP